MDNFHSFWYRMVSKWLIVWSNCVEYACYYHLSLIQLIRDQLSHLRYQNQSSYYLSILEISIASSWSFIYLWCLLGQSHFKLEIPQWVGNHVVNFPTFASCWLSYFLEQRIFSYRFDKYPLLLLVFLAFLLERVQHKLGVWYSPESIPSSDYCSVINRYWWLLRQRSYDHAIVIYCLILGLYLYVQFLR